MQALNELLLGTMTEEDANHIASKSILELLMASQKRISQADVSVWHAVDQGSSDEELYLVLNERSAALVSFIRLSRAYNCVEAK